MRRASLAIVLFISSPSLRAQDVQPDQVGKSSDQKVGQTAGSGVGQVGQRLTREETAPTIEPMDRISSRVQNRVQSRIRNRIDRFYNPEANAASPFEVAGDRTRTAGRPRRR